MSGRILIVGATGFLGSFVTRRLADRAPIVLARPSSDISESTVPTGLEIRYGDLDRPAALPFDDVECLVFCASMGFGHIPGLLDRLAVSSVSRAVFVSTTAIFTTLPAASRAPRLAAETHVQSAPLAWTILRPTMIYGAARDRNISRLLRFLRRSPLFPVCGNALWQPVHVEDVADAVVASLDSPRTVRRIYNLPGADALGFGDLVQTAARAIGRRVILLPVPVEMGVLGARLTRVVRPEQIRRLSEDKAFSCEDAARDFAYRPRTFATGVADEARLLGFRPPQPARQRHDEP